MLIFNIVIAHSRYKIIADPTIIQSYLKGNKTSMFVLISGTWFGLYKLITTHLLYKLIELISSEYYTTDPPLTNFLAPYDRRANFPSNQNNNTKNQWNNANNIDELIQST